MVGTILKIISAALILIGTFFFCTGLLGLIRLPDIYTRIHSTGKCNTVGVASMVFGLVIYQGIDLMSLKLIFILVFILIINPTSAHVLARGAHKYGIDTYDGTDFDKYKHKYEEN